LNDAVDVVKRQALWRYFQVYSRVLSRHKRRLKWRRLNSKLTTTR